MIPYAGIGSRETPEDVLKLMRDIGYRLSCEGRTLRSGAAPGADTAFEDGAWDATFFSRQAARPEIFLPWPRFEGRRKTVVVLEEPLPEAFDIAAQFHPNWFNLKPGAKALHARNAHQVLGADLQSPSRYVICWTPGGGKVGGTAQALRMAEHYKIPVLNLALDAPRLKLERHVGWQ